MNNLSMSALRNINAPVSKYNKEFNLNLFTPVEQNKFIVVMPDDTMTGEIECRDKVIIDTTPMRYLEDGIFAFFWAGIFMIKRLQFVKDNIRVIPTSRFYETWEIPSNERLDLMIIGRVIYSQEIRSH
ncbi:S24 family peptidase [Yersinia enterocolitica]|uniref:S24 family peptidase n=1 Tax=Yersinia enterocolitica TaxID=630 RepID=UPI0029473CD3|nr:S24 family peptidase [Yersinia enterocolitica]EKN3829176.1 S24 family peptidase [Yersinia enterocolitica]EKN4827474.1 S24 family peptidase [Yersinia enterocolitica]EKN6270959.1 S24 family peptidase [Yersinia enterocolitica]ELW8140389.1 S24 family peptidase [Yersinia enterocolitica]